MNILYLGTILATVLLTAVGQLVLKIGVNQLTQNPDLVHSNPDFLVRAFLSPVVFSGLVIYGVALVLWLWVLSKVNLSFAYPFIGLSFIITLLFSAYILHEPVNSFRIMGTLLIAIGCVFVAKS